MGKFWQSRQPLKMLGVELCDNGFCYSLVECGRENKVLYEGKDFPAFSFDALALVTDKVIEHNLPLRDVRDGEMLMLLQNEMNLTWGLAPEEYQLTWLRSEGAGHQVQVGFLANKDFQACLNQGSRISANLKALVPARRRVMDNVEDIFYAARHGALVAAGGEEDLNFIKTCPDEHQLQRRRQLYLQVAKAVGIFTGLVLSGLVLLYGFSRYKIYVARQALDVLREAGEEYDFYMETKRRINFLTRKITGLGKQHLFRTEQVEGILDAMPDSDNEIKVLRTKDGAGARVSVRGLVLEGRVGEMRQLKKFVEQLHKISAFGTVNIGNSKSLGQEGFGYTLDITYGDRARGK